MAKPPAKPSDANQEETGTDLALVGVGTDLAEFASDELEGLSGYGYSEKREDNLVPILGILQDNSAEVKRNHAKMIEGAKAGDLIIRSLRRVVDVDTNDIPVIPCASTHYWVEWEGEPGDGKPVNQYPFDDRPADAREIPDPQNDDKKILVMPNGNRLVDTRYWYAMCFIGDSWKEVVIPMAGTNHTVSRSWNSVQMEKRIPGGGKAPSWFYAYGLSTKFNQRGQQSWYTYEVKELGWNQNKELRAKGRRIFEQVQAGELVADLNAAANESASRPNADAI